MFRIVPLCVLVAFFGCVRSGDAGAQGDARTAAAGGVAESPEGGLETATFAGGCFWCIDAPFEDLDGVKKVVSGYAGGASGTRRTSRSPPAPPDTSRPCRSRSTRR